MADVVIAMAKERMQVIACWGNSQKESEIKKRTISGIRTLQKKPDQKERIKSWK